MAGRKFQKKDHDYVSKTAWEKALVSDDKRFKKIEKNIASIKETISKDSIEFRKFKTQTETAVKRMDKEMKELDKRLDEKVSRDAWQVMCLDVQKNNNRINGVLSKIRSLEKTMHLIDKKIASKISRDAWEKANQGFNDELDKKSDKENVNHLMNDLKNVQEDLNNIKKSLLSINEDLDQKSSKDNVKRMMLEQDSMKSKVRAVEAKDMQFDNRLAEIENIFKNYRTTEEALRELIENLKR